MCYKSEKTLSDSALDNRATRHISRICNKLKIPKLAPMQKILGHYFSAEDFETSVNMVKENFRLFLRVINVTIIGKKEILKMLHDYIFPVVNYDSIKNQYNADGFKHLVYQ